MKQMLLFLLLSSSMPLIAQKTSKTRLGIRLGYSISNIKGTEVELYQSQGGKLKKGSHILMGVVFQQHLKNDRLLIQTELNYLTKGGRLENSGFYETPNKQAAYLQIPVMLSYDLVGSSQLAFSVEGGFAMSYAIKPIEFNEEYYTTPESIKTPKFMITPVAGATLLFKGSAVEPYFNMRYDFDFQKYFGRTTPYKEYFIKHSGTISLALGVLLKVN